MSAPYLIKYSASGMPEHEEDFVWDCETLEEAMQMAEEAALRQHKEICRFSAVPLTKEMAEEYGISDWPTREPAF